RAGEVEVLRPGAQPLLLDAELAGHAAELDRRNLYAGPRPATSGIRVIDLGLRDHPGSPIIGAAMGSQASCLTEGEIMSFLAGALRDVAGERIEPHLEACEACARVVAEAARNSAPAG